MMKDASSDFAVFVTDTGISLILRQGHLYDDRNKLIPGITGRIRINNKRVELITADHDVQVFLLGQKDDKEQADDKSGGKPQ
jgi:hypothetical protein